MKYTSILAGALGLMALAACTNNDEVTLEQPKVAQTIAVTYGNGADTRFTLSDFDKTEGIKASWTKNDEIAFITDGLTEPISFIADADGQTAPFRLVGGTELEDGKTYTVAYPPVYLTKGIDLSEQTGLFKDMIEVDAVAAVGEAKYENNKLNAVTLKPVCSFIRIPARTTINGLERIMLNTASIEFTATNLMTHIPVVEVTTKAVAIPTIEIIPTEDVFEASEGQIRTTTDLYIAIPVSDSPITNMALRLRGPSASTTASGKYETLVYSIVNNDGETSAIISEGGKVYTISTTNLALIEK